MTIDISFAKMIKDFIIYKILQQLSIEYINKTINKKNMKIVIYLSQLLGRKFQQ